MMIMTAESFKKCVLVAVLIFALTYAVTGDWDDYDDRPCHTDEDCHFSDCCVEDPRSADGRRSCQDKGDDPGEPCGGPHFCGCEPRFQCVPFVAPPARRLRGYYHLANGSCEYDPDYFRNYRRGQRPYRRHHDSDSDEHDSDFDDDRR